MAKGPAKSGGVSKIRFVMFEAEIADGDVGQITQAITNALRPAISNPTVKRIAVSAPQANGEQHADSDVIDEAAEEIEAATVPPVQARSRAPRKPPKAPDIADIDMNSDVSLSVFADGKDSGSQHKKYLIAAAWLKEHRSINAVDANHIYTCFRSLGWSTNIPDFWQPLRDLKARKYFSKNASGNYEINHIGLDHVKKLGGNAVS